jgi:hypothetical protein
MAGFTAALNSDAVNASTRHEFNITSAFDYKEYVTLSPSPITFEYKNKARPHRHSDSLQQSTHPFVNRDISYFAQATGPGASRRALHQLVPLWYELNNCNLLGLHAQFV